MLNELYRLSSNLQKCGIQLGDLHQNIKTPGKAAGFIVGIDQNGMPKTVEHISADNMHKLWTLRKGQHNSFPYIKLKKPILDVKFDDPIYEKLKSKKTKPEEKTAILVQATQNYDLSNKQDLSLAEWTQSQIAEVEGKDQKLAALVDLVKRLPKNEASSKSFLKNLTVLLMNNFNKLTVDLITTLMVGDRKEKERKIVCDVSLFFDVSDWEKYLCRVAHPEMGLLVSKYLPNAAVDNKKDGKSAFGGSELHMESYPDPNLPLIGRIYLFSMNQDAPCHNRYGKIGSAIFPASPDEVRSMHGAIKWCVADERKGKTWQGVPNVNRKQDLLIAYLEEKPQNAIELASIFAASDVNEGEIVEAAFENKAKTVCAALRGEAGLTDNSQVNVIVISKVDEGRAQVVLSTAYTIKNIIQSVEEWRTAANNRPSFSLLLPGKKGEKALQVEPTCPSPTDVMKCFQNQWIKSGLDKRDIPGVYLRHVYDLYLGDTMIARHAANNFLRFSLQQLGELFIGYGGADHANTIKEYSPDARKTLLRGISVIAIVLYKLGIKKEDYMKNAAFNVGRMLALADKLHEQYCRHVRKNEVPPQLIGNALMHTALDNPTKGLARLSERLPIYQAWATKVQGDDVGLAKWVLGQMGQVSAGLENTSIPTQADDAVKTQILLGYLAHVKNEG
jgi:hypothetical protein